MKISTKIAAFILIVISITGIVITVFVYTANFKMLEKETIKRLETIAFNTMDTIDRTLYERYSDIQMMMIDPIISSRKSTPKKITKQLIRYRNAYKMYVSLSFFDLNRMRIADTAGVEIGKQHSPRKYFDEVLEGKVSAASNIYTSGSTGQTNIHFAAPVKDEEGVMFGIVVARMPIDKIYEITKRKAQEYIEHRYEEIEIDLVDKTGLLLYSNYNKKNILKDNLFDREVVKKIKTKSTSVSGYLKDWDPILKENDLYIYVHEQGYLNFKGNNWMLLFHVSEKTALASVDKLKNRLIAILFTITVITVLIALIGSRKFTRPISKLQYVVKEIGKGNLDVKIESNSADEMGDLARSFGYMAKDLKQTVVSRDYVDNIVNSMADMLIVLTPDGKIKKINRVTVDILGYNEQELIGKDISFLLQEEEGGERILFKGSKLDKFVTKGELRDQEMNFKTKDLRTIPVLLSGAVMSKVSCPEEGPVDDCLEFKKKGKHCEHIQGIILAGKDITERKKAEEALKNYARHIKEINRELDDFAYIVSHDLKEPLSTVIAFSGFIEADHKDKLNEEAKGYLERIKSNASLMHRLINDLLAISRIGREKVPFEEIEVEKIIEKVKLRLELAIRQKDAELIIVNKLPKIFCDRVRLTEVFYNLVSNAIKYADKQQTKIEFGSKQEKDFYEFYVKDNGPGMEEKYFKTIFEIFNRADRSKDHEGTGVGLAIVKKIVEMHQGKIWVESKLGEGSTFYFTISKDEDFIMKKRKIGEILT
ncbi:MAG: PAS domain S-box protein [PVC group bacterium]|nr:PAS domain S-box protein [PVC group bacterium]